MDRPQKQRKFSDYFYNRITYVGCLLTFIIFFIELLLFGIDFINDHPNVYLGLITYTLLPPFLLLGVALIPMGALRRRRQILKGKTAHDVPIYVNLNNPKHLKAFIIFVVGMIILVVMSAVGSYQAFHYTESVHFCGITCHEVMEPQFTRYVQSPHARVKCVECHIGAGADWYVKSKLSGVRQVFAVFRNTYPRPIPNPIRNLRPAKETCEQCHWPEKFYSSFELRRDYFLAEPDSDYSRWFIRMLIQMGNTGQEKTGIHTHMYLDNDIYYVAEDERRQNITWVKTVNKKGATTIYTSPDSSYKDKEPPAELIRKMDCIDCHNRPTHRFLPPNKLVDASMAAGTIDPALPGIKSEAMKVLSAEYATAEEALMKIRQSLRAYYEKELGADYAQQKMRVEQTADEVATIFKNNFFPRMKTRWDKYPDNIGHMTSAGCFRCHGGEHASADGKVITRNCTACHVIIEQGPHGNVEKSTDGLPFRHPVDIGDMWQEMNCTECHTGN